MCFLGALEVIKRVTVINLLHMWCLCQYFYYKIGEKKNESRVYNICPGYHIKADFGLLQYSKLVTSINTHYSSLSNTMEQGDWYQQDTTV